MLHIIFQLLAQNQKLIKFSYMSKVICVSKNRIRGNKSRKFSDIKIQPVWSRDKSMMNYSCVMILFWYYIVIWEIRCLFAIFWKRKFMLCSTASHHPSEVSPKYQQAFHIWCILPPLEKGEINLKCPDIPAVDKEMWALTLRYWNETKYYFYYYFL